MFAPLEAEKRAEHREVRWISLGGDPSSGRMTNRKICLADIYRIVRGETTVSISDLSFRDPNFFKSGELRTCIDLWKDILEGYDQAENVLEWIGKGVNIKEFMRPFRGSFMGVDYDSTNPPSRAFKNHHSCKHVFAVCHRDTFTAHRDRSNPCLGSGWGLKSAPLGPSNDNRTAEAQVMH